LRLQLFERRRLPAAAIEVQVALEDVGGLLGRGVERLLWIVAHEVMRRRLCDVRKKTYSGLHVWLISS